MIVHERHNLGEIKIYIYRKHRELDPKVLYN